MSLISDLQDIVGSGGGQNYIIDAYPQPPDPTKQISLYGVFEQSIQQQNVVAVKPLEQSNFTSDSVQIKPYIIGIRGIILPPEQLMISDSTTVATYIQNQIAFLRNMVNGIQLFTLGNPFSYGTYAPLKLIGLNTLENVDLTVPEITLTFMQVQISTATGYSTGTIGTTAQPQNSAQTQSTGGNTVNG